MLGIGSREKEGEIEAERNTRQSDKAERKITRFEISEKEG